MSRDLRGRIEATTEQALASGALQPIRADTAYLEEAGVRFVVHALSSLVRKDQAAAQPRNPEAKKPAPSAPFDPFAQPEPDLVVDPAFTGTHYLLLNKFNVMDRHLLIVTRAYEQQEALIGEADFDALTRCLLEIDGLGFYNAGRESGASQPHKHLQWRSSPNSAPTSQIRMRRPRSTTAGTRIALGASGERGAFSLQPRRFSPLPKPTGHPWPSAGTGHA
ncbi:MAG: hypothetical protein A3H39_08465 [candidate division NC10 bacterium RIFCSPLOWO2_02_FULL_66_22]|nr:MAG: hypothetical protein A3H39_08465 [candidate division NC10 bacterium RIFCSPLOWO2_02_FULL_66_22]